MYVYCNWQLCIIMHMQKPQSYFVLKIQSEVIKPTSSTIFRTPLRLQQLYIHIQVGTYVIYTSDSYISEHVTYHQLFSKNNNTWTLINWWQSSCNIHSEVVEHYLVLMFYCYCREWFVEANSMALQHYHKMVLWTIHSEQVDYSYKGTQNHMALPKQLLAYL